MSVGDNFWDDLVRYAASLEPQLAKAIRDVIDRLRRDTSMEDAVAAVANGDPELILRNVELEDVQFALRDAITEAAEHMLETAPARFRGVRFDILNPFAVSVLQDQELRSVQYLADDIRAGIRQYIEAGLLRGINPRQTAREMKELVGLPARLTQAIANYRRSLEEPDQSDKKRALRYDLRDRRFDNTVRRALENDERLEQEYIDKLVARYIERVTQYQAEVVARSETMQALITGGRLGWEQMIDAGKVERDTLRRFWIVARDERTCERCKPIPALNPDGVGFDQAFVTPEGSVFAPILHFQCRCVVLTKVVETADAAVAA